MKEFIKENWGCILSVSLTIILCGLFLYGTVKYTHAHNKRVRASNHEFRISEAKRIKDTNTLRVETFESKYSLTRFIRDKRVKNIIYKDG